MNEKYLNYQRKEVNSQAKYLLIAQSVILGLLVLMIIKNFFTDNHQPKVIFFALLNALPMSLVGLMKIIACKKLLFVDLFGLAYLFGYLLTLLILRITDWIDLGFQESI